MKRNLLLLAMMALAVFAFSGTGLAQPCPQDTIDRGACDSLYLNVYPPDTSFETPYDQVKFPMYLTNDIYDPDLKDSIAGVVLPMQFTYTNAASKCSLKAYYNTTAITTGPSFLRSIFRDIGSDVSWMKRIYEAGLPDNNWLWANIIMWLATDPVTQSGHLWLMMAPNVEPSTGGAKHDLTVTMTFSIFDSTEICIDTMTWVTEQGAINRLAFSRLDAKTYVPRMSWKPGGKQEEEWYCRDIVIIPNLPPTVTCPSNQSHNTNGVKTATGVDVVDPDCPDASHLSSWSATFAGTGVDPLSVQLVNVNQTDQCHWTADVQYNVTDHCMAGGTITVTAFDNAGGQGQCTFNIALTNTAPHFTDCPDDFSMYTGKTWSGGNPVATDDEGDGFAYSLGIVPTPPVLPGPVIDPVTGVITWVPAAGNEGTYTVTITVTENTGTCRLTNSECVFDVTVNEILNAEVNIGPTLEDCYNPGDLVYLPIYISSGFYNELGGFDLHVDFDYTSMTFVGADKGELINGTQYGNFEKFTYRLLPCPSCGCCKYKILLFGMYDLPNATTGTPIPESATGVLVWLKFVINSDENLRGLVIPVCWQWTPCEYQPPVGGPFDPDCGENTFSDDEGNILFTSALLCQFDPLCCDDQGDVDQYVMFQTYDIFTDSYRFPAECGYVCGGIQVCGGGHDLCKRGDVNYNNVTYEVADAVLFASYFVDGIGVFGPAGNDRDYKVCATDVNADGRPLLLSDLVYLIRVILKDAVAIPKLAPSSDIANVIVSNGVITTECASSIGAILFEFEGTVSPTLLANNMEMLSNGNKVLVWSQNGNSIMAASEVLSVGDAKLTSVTAVDRDSRELTTAITAKVAPTTFTLHPAYPNPFNPFTNLSFTLPEAVSYGLKIYNVAGQLVRSYEAMGKVGLNVISWDGKDNAGNAVSSGVYFYKLTAGKFSATEKMVMMK